MNTTVGIDLLYLPNFVASYDKAPQFLASRLFTAEELKLHTTMESLAGVFAAKEAVLKAISPERLQLTELVVKKNEVGKPYISCPSLELKYDIEISISHDHEYVTAIAYAYLK